MPLLNSNLHGTSYTRFGKYFDLFCYAEYRQWRGQVNIHQGSEYTLSPLVLLGG